MRLEHVIDLCRAFQAANLSFWVDGGWGVDALLGTQTRAHSDLDLAVLRNDLSAFAAVLEGRGYVRADRPDDPNWNWVLQDGCGRSVDLHGFTPDALGNGVLGDPGDGLMYPALSLEGAGVIGDIPLRCIAAPFVLQFRNSFEPRDVDRLDVMAICSRFDLPKPSRFV